MICVWKATIYVSVGTAVNPLRSSKTEFLFRFHENIIFDLHLKCPVGFKKHGDSINWFW